MYTDLCGNSTLAHRYQTAYEAPPFLAISGLSIITLAALMALPRPVLAGGDSCATIVGIEFSACNTQTCNTTTACSPIKKYSQTPHPKLQCGFNPWVGECENHNLDSECQTITYYLMGCGQGATSVEVVRRNTCG